MAGIDEFIRGERDCRDGKPADLKGGRDYTSGYNFQYQLAEMQSNASKNTQQRLHNRS